MTTLHYIFESAVRLVLRCSTAGQGRAGYSKPDRCPARRWHDDRQCPPNHQRGMAQLRDAA